MGKEKNISIRVSEYQYNKLKKEAKECGYSNLSEYTRMLLSGNREQSIIAKSSDRNLAELNKGLCIRVNKELIKLQHNIETLPNNGKYNREELKEGVYEIWQLLNY